MGSVYLAREKALERSVAIKILPPETATDADSRERFRREARVAAKLTHPNIVPLHTFGDVEGMLYFVMGYVKGESLAERMRREGKLPEEDVRRILAEVADALHYAHKLGVVHRDIKPDNILIDDESGRPMLTDFGVAKAKASGTTLTAAGAVVGTPYYMSPEQASGAQEIDGRSDLYSLGVMGYQMLAGRVPFEGASVQDVLVQHVTREPAPLGALAPDASPDLAATVMRCLEKEPAQRWADAHRLRAELSTTDDEDDLPSYEAQVRGAGFWGVAAGWLAGVVGVLTYWHPGSLNENLLPWIRWWHVMLGTAGVCTVMLGGLILGARFRGLPWGTVRTRALSPPSWWPFWWPRRWRHASDVWDRLPRWLRLTRNLVGAGAVGFLAISVPAFFVISGGGAEWIEPLLLPILMVPVLLFGWTPLVPLFIGTLSSIRGRKRSAVTRSVAWSSVLVAGARMDTDAFSRLLFAPTSRRAFWSKPKFSALLASPRDRALPRSREPRSPEEYAQAIRDLVSQLPSGTRATVSEAGDAARQVAELVASLDTELANLARDADPQELEAVETKLRALGPGAPTEGEVRREKRALLVHQRDLLRRLDERLGELRERRSRLADLLHSMWLQVANLRAEAARDTLAVTEISGRIKALCTDIDAHLKAAETVRAELR